MMVQYQCYATYFRFQVQQGLTDDAPLIYRMALIILDETATTITLLNLDGSVNYDAISAAFIGMFNEAAATVIGKSLMSC